MNVEHPLEIPWGMRGFDDWAYAVKTRRGKTASDFIFVE